MCFWWKWTIDGANERICINIFKLLSVHPKSLTNSCIWNICLSHISYCIYIIYNIHFFFLTLVKLYWILSWCNVSEKNKNKIQQDELRWKSMNSKVICYYHVSIDLWSNVTCVLIHCKQTSGVMLYTIFLVIKYQIEPNNVYFPGSRLLQCKLVTYIIYV